MRRFGAGGEECRTVFWSARLLIDFGFRVEGLALSGWGSGVMRGLGFEIQVLVFRV